jgi:hypothetical protein
MKCTNAVSLGLPPRPLFGKYLSLGLRLEGEVFDGKVPFFGYPFVNLRGIPAMRY